MVMTTADKNIYTISMETGSGKTANAFSMLGNTQGMNDVPSTDIMFLLDCTGSMTDKLEQVKGFINNFTEKLVSQANNTRLGLIEFRDRQMGRDHQIHTFESTTDFFTQDLTLFNHKLDNLEAEGGFGYEASGLDAILFALNQPFREEGKKIIVLFTDGDPRLPDIEAKTIKQVATAIEEAGAQLYVVSLSDSSMADQPSNVLIKSEIALLQIELMETNLSKKSEYSKLLNKILKLAGKQSDFQVYQKLVRKVEGQFFNYDEDETKMMETLLGLTQVISDYYEDIIITKLREYLTECLNHLEKLLLIEQEREQLLKQEQWKSSEYVRGYKHDYQLAQSIFPNRDYERGYQAGFNDYLDRGEKRLFYWFCKSSEYIRGYDKGYQLAQSNHLIRLIQSLIQDSQNKYLQNQGWYALPQKGCWWFYGNDDYRRGYKDGNNLNYIPFNLSTKSSDYLQGYFAGKSKLYGSGNPNHFQVPKSSESLIQRIRKFVRSVLEFKTRWSFNFLIIYYEDELLSAPEKNYFQSKLSWKLWREQVTIKKMKTNSVIQLWKSFMRLNLTSRVYCQYAQLRASPNLHLNDTSRKLLRQNLMMSRRIKLKKEIPKNFFLSVSIPHRDYGYHRDYG